MTTISTNNIIGTTINSHYKYHIDCKVSAQFINIHHIINLRECESTSSSSTIQNHGPVMSPHPPTTGVMTQSRGHTRWWCFLVTCCWDHRGWDHRGTVTRRLAPLRWLLPLPAFLRSLGPQDGVDSGPDKPFQQPWSSFLKDCWPRFGMSGALGTLVHKQHK